MNYHPILFNGEMVRAILAGTKTQTRRPITRLKGFGKITELHVSTTPGYDWAFRDSRQLWNEITNADMLAAGPLGGPGGRLWVRERQRVIVCYIGNDGSFEIRVRYEADGAESDWLPWPLRLKGQPVVDKCLSMGGYRESSRTTLLVKRTWIEQVRDISEEDAIAEGLIVYEGGPLSPLYDHTHRDDLGFDCPVKCFHDLWDSIYAKRGLGWKENPWVAACEFSLIETEKARKS